MMLEKNLLPLPTAFICPANTNRMMAALSFGRSVRAPGALAQLRLRAFTAVIKAIVASEKVYVICGAKHLP